MSLLNLKQKKEEDYFQKNTLQSTKKEPEYSGIHYDYKKNLNTESSLIIGEKVVVTGTVKAEDLVTIQGTIDGDIDCNKISVKKSGIVKGKINTKNATVEGQLDGEINITSILHIKSNGKVNGKISYGIIQIDEGGSLQGEIKSEKPISNSKSENKSDWNAL